jgi:hypothetical protein
MKYALLVMLLIADSSSLANARGLEARAQARTDCQMQVSARNYMPGTVRWKNAVRQCMIDRGFNGD